MGNFFGVARFCDHQGVWRSKYGDVKYPDITVGQLNAMACEKFGETVAQHDGMSGASVTFKDYLDRQKAFAAGLTKQGLTKGAVFGILLPNCLEYGVAFNGALLLGVACTTLNPAYTPEELKHCVALTEPEVVLTNAALLPALKAALEALGKAPKVVVLEEDAAQAAGALPFSSLLVAGGDFVENTDPDALAVLPYSSGTTGLPKAVMLTHRNLVSQIHQLAANPEIVGLGKDDVLLAVLPFFHIYGMVVLLLMATFVGAKIVLMPKFDPAKYVELLAEQKVTVAHVAPPIVNFLAKHPAVEKHLPFPALRELFSGAAPLGDELASAAKARLGITCVRQGYGMTEMSPASHIGRKTNASAGAAGMLLPGMRMRIVDVDGNNVRQPRLEGEICCAGPNIMKGYFKNDQATAECIDADGYLHTGDVGYIDEDGQVWIVDRVKELIKTKGFQVAPAELEAKLLEHPQILDAAVIGVAAGFQYGGQPGDGQLPKAFVVRKDDSLTEAAVKEHIEKLTTRYKWLAAVQFIETVPKSASGKILRKNLRKMEEEAGGKVFA